MATPSMQSGRVVGTVKGVDGVVTAINERGVIRTLKPGDKVYAGETIQTADGANAHIDFSRGGFATLGAGQSLPMDGIVLSQAADAAKPQAGQTQSPAASDADIEKLQQQIEEAIAKGEDPTQLLEAAAAGPGAGGGGAEEGSSFVSVEQLAARGELTPGFDTGTFSVEFQDPYEYDGRETPGGDFDFEIRTSFGDGTFVPYVYEDWQPNRNQAAAAPEGHLGDRTEMPGRILFEFNGTGTTVVSNIHLEGFTQGTVLYKFNPQTGDYEPIQPNTDGSYDLSHQDFNDGVYVKPPLNDDTDMNIDVRLDLQVNGGGTSSIGGSFVIPVDAVADRPENVAGEGAIETIDGSLVIDGSDAKEDLADGWAKTEIEKNATNVNDEAVTIEGNVSISATFFDRDGSETHTLYIEKPDQGKLGYYDNNGAFQEFPTWDENSNFYRIPEFDAYGDPILDKDSNPIVTWGNENGIEPGSWDANVNCVYQADGKTDDLTNDFELDLEVKARAEETTFGDGTETDADDSNNRAENQSSALEGTNVKVKVDSVDSTLTVKAGWASEGNDPAKNKTGNTTELKDMYDKVWDADSNQYVERGDGSGAADAKIDGDSTAGAKGAPVVVEISGTTSNPEAVKEVVLKAAVDGKWLVDGVDVASEPGGKLAVGNTTYEVDSFGNLKVYATDSTDIGNGINMGDKLTFQPENSQSHADISFDYKVTVVADSGASAVYNGSSTIVVDAVADTSTVTDLKADYKQGSAAGHNQPIDLEIDVKFNDNTETKFVVINATVAKGQGWDFGVTDLLSKNAVNDVFRNAAGTQSDGSYKMPESALEGILNPTSSPPGNGSDDDGQYILMQIVEDTNSPTGYSALYFDGNDWINSGATVTSGGVSGEYHIEYPVKAPAADTNPADVWVKPVSVVPDPNPSSDPNGDNEYDYGNNISGGDGGKVQLEVSGVGSKISIDTKVAYEGNTPNKHIDNKNPAIGGAITLKVDSGADNKNPDVLEKIVFKYDSSEGKINMPNLGLTIESGWAFVFAWEVKADGSIGYTSAQLVDADGHNVGDPITFASPGAPLEVITAGMYYTPNDTSVSDVDVDIDYVATFTDPASGTTGYVSSGDAYEKLLEDGNNSHINEIDDNLTNKNDNNQYSQDKGNQGGEVVVDAVADKPSIDKNGVSVINEDGNTGAKEGDTIKMSVKDVVFKDYADGSENHYLVIQKDNNASKIVGGGNTTVSLGDLKDQTITITGADKLDGSKTWTQTITIVNGEMTEIKVTTGDGQVTTYTKSNPPPGMDWDDASHDLVSGDQLQYTSDTTNGYYKVPVVNEFLNGTDGKIGSAEVELEVPGNITSSDQTITVNVGAAAEEREDNVPSDEDRLDNNYAYDWTTGKIDVNVAGDASGKATIGYEDGDSSMKGQQVNDPKTDLENAVITIKAGNADHFLGSIAGEAADTGAGEVNGIIITFKFDDSDGAKPGKFVFNGVEYEAQGSGGNYTVTIPPTALEAAANSSPTGLSEAKVTYIPTTNDDTDLTNVEVTVTTKADTSSDTHTDSYEVTGSGGAPTGTIIIDAVADMPKALSPDGKVDGTPDYGKNDQGQPNKAAEVGESFKINMGKPVQFYDYEDGSENHSLLVQKTGITGKYDNAPGDVTNITLADLQDQTITIKGGSATQTITIANGEMTIVVDDGTNPPVTYSASNLPDGWDASDWSTAFDALVTGDKITSNGSGSDYFKVPVLNEFLQASDGKVDSADIEVAINDNKALDQDTTLQINTGAQAHDVPGDLDDTSKDNNIANITNPTDVKVGVVTSVPGVSIGSNQMSENLTPDAHEGDFVPGAGVGITISNLHAGETATVTLYFGLKEDENGDRPDLPATYDDNDKMRVEYEGETYYATKEVNGNGDWTGRWVCEDVKVTGGGASDPVLIYKPGYNYNDLDIEVEYEMTVRDDASGAETTFQNHDDSDKATYQPGELDIKVDAVAQRPDVIKVDVAGLENGATHVEAGKPVVIKGEVKFFDTADGSEDHYVLVEVNEKVGQLTSVTIDGVPVSLEGAILVPVLQSDGSTKYFYQLEVPKSVVDSKGPDGSYSVDVEASYQPGSSTTGGQTVSMGGLAMEDGTTHNTTTNLEDDYDNNKAINWIESEKIFFSTPGGVGISGKPLYENDMPNTHLPDQSSPTGYDQTKANGAQITLSESGNADITKAEFTFDSKEGTLIFDGEPVIIWDNGKPVVNPALDVDGLTVKVDASGKVTVTFDNAENPGLTDQLLGPDPLVPNDPGSSLSYVPNENYSDKDINLGYKVDFVNPETGIKDTTGNEKLPLVVDAVAQKPADAATDIKDIDVSGSDAGTPGQKTVEVDMKVTVDFGNPFDADKSEGHYVLVEVMANMTVKGAGVDIYMLNGKEYWRIPVDVDDIVAGNGKVTVDLTVEFVGDHDLLHALGKHGGFDTGMEVGALALEQDDRGQIFTGEDGNQEIRIDNNAAYTSGGEVEIDYNWTHGGTHYDLHVEPVYENDTPNAHLAYRPDESVKVNGEYKTDVDGYLINDQNQKINPDGTPYTGDPSKGWLLASDGSLVNDAGMLIDDKGNLITDAENPGGFPAEAGGGLVTIGGIGNSGTEGSFTFTLEEGEGYLLVDGNWVAIGNGTTVTVTKDQYDQGIRFKPGVNFDDTDVKLKVEGFASNDGSGAPLDSDSTQVIVDAVAQKPMNLESAASYKEASWQAGDPIPEAIGIKDGHGNEGTVKVVLSGEFADSTDGSEKHYGLMEVTGEYTPDGTYDIIQGPDGKYYYQIELEADGNGKYSKEVTITVNKDAMGGEYSEISIGTGLLSREKNTGDADDWELTVDNNLAWTIDGSVDVVYSTVGANVSVGVNDTYEGDANGSGGEISLGVTLGQHDVLTEIEVSYDNTNGDVVSSNPLINLDNYLSESGSTTTIDIMSLLKDNNVDPADADAVKGFLDSLGLRFVAEGTGSEDGSVSWKITVKDQLSGDEKTWDGSKTMVIDAVGNAPTVEAGSVGFDAGGNSAATSGGDAKASITLNFADTDKSETHYAILEQHSSITCNSAWVNGVLVTDIKTFYGADGKLYFAVEVPNNVSPVKVDFNITAKNVGTDLDMDGTNGLKIGGVAIEKTTGLGSDKEITLTNNRGETIADDRVPVKIGVVQTTEAGLKDAHVVESTDVAVALKLTTADGGDLEALLDTNHEVISGMTFTVTQAGSAEGALIGWIVYDGVDYPVTISGGKAVVEITNLGDGFDWGKGIQFKPNPDNHNSTDIKIGTELEVKDMSGDTGTINIGNATITVAATADAAASAEAKAGKYDEYGQKIVGSDTAEAVAGHASKVTVTLDAKGFVDRDGSEDHYFLVKTDDGVKVEGGTEITVTQEMIDSGAVPPAWGLQPGDTIWKVDVADNAENVSQEITLIVPESVGSNTTISSVAVSEEKASDVGDGGTKYAYEGSNDLTVDVVTDPNMAPEGTSEDADLDVVRGHLEVSGDLLENVTDPDLVANPGADDKLSVKEITEVNGATADSSNVTDNGTTWTVKGQYGEWTIVKATGEYTYTRTAGLGTEGDRDILKFTVQDGRGGELEQTHTVNMIKGGNDTKPQLVAETHDSAIQKIITGSFAFKDTEKDIVAISSAALAGATVVQNGDGTWTITHPDGVLTIKEGVTGADGVTRFEYEFAVNDSIASLGSYELNIGVTDALGATGSGKVTINLTPLEYDITTGGTYTGLDGNNDPILGWDLGAHIDVATDAATLQAGAGADVITVNGDSNTIDGGAGDDTINVTGSDNTIDGGDGADKITVVGHENEISGGLGDDTIHVTGNDNVIDGGDGADKITVKGNDNEIDGGDGNDIIHVTGDDNVIDGGDGNDTITVIGDSNEIHAGAGNDIISVDGDMNLIYADTGSNTITLNDTGSNTIKYNVADAETDTIHNFKIGGDHADVLDLSDLLSGAGTNSADALVAGGYLNLDVQSDNQGGYTVTVTVDMDGGGSNHGAVELATIHLDGYTPGSGGDLATDLLNQLVDNKQIKFD